MLLTMFRVYRALDLLLIIYFVAFFGRTNGVVPAALGVPIGLLVAVSLVWRLVTSYAPGKDSALFDLKECTHHHMAVRRR